MISIPPAFPAPVSPSLKRRAPRRRSRIPAVRRATLM
nr:MAG TPA_asm: hypothetical protein [Caudoviricetes sp.]